MLSNSTIKIEREIEIEREGNRKSEFYFIVEAKGPK
jgi:hypothetical protein